MIILSHWDLDHYLGIALYDYEKLFNKVWIARSEAKSQTAKRIINIIFKVSKRKLLISDYIDTEKIMLGDNLVIYRNKSSKAKDYINNNGLSIYINKKSKNVNLLKLVSVGDVAYENMHKDFKEENKLDILVAYHHGSGNYKKNIFESNNNSKSIAIIPVGCNTHKHPTEIAINDLKSKGFNIYRTDGLKENFKCDNKCEECEINNNKYIEFDLEINEEIKEELDVIIDEEISRYPPDSFYDRYEDGVFHSGVFHSGIWDEVYLNIKSEIEEVLEREKICLPIKRYFIDDNIIDDRITDAYIDSYND